LYTVYISEDLRLNVKLSQITVTAHVYLVIILDSSFDVKIFVVFNV